MAAILAIRALIFAYRGLLYPPLYSIRPQSFRESATLYLYAS